MISFVPDGVAWLLMAMSCFAPFAQATRTQLMVAALQGSPAKTKPVENAVSAGVISPLILYTDIVSGPVSGGEHNDGTYLTIFGAHFGATQGTSSVTINGHVVAQYLLWSDKKIGIQVGRVGTGPIVVSVDGHASNSDKTFKARSGHIYFVGPAVDNSAPGNCGSMLGHNSFANPWGLTNYASNTESDYNPAKMRTPYTYASCISPSDTLVFLDGVSYSHFDGRGWHSALTVDRESTSAGNFLTLMARPGATARLGGEGGATYAIRNTGASTYSVYSGLTLTGSGPDGNALSPDKFDRIVGNTIECPDCSGPQGALTGADDVTALGNTVRNISTDSAKLPGGSNKTYHAVYFAGNNLDIGWNHIYSTAAYNGIQINEDHVTGFHDLLIHDNDIADVNGSGINLSTVDPSAGKIAVYNNVIHHVGLKTASDGGGYDPHSCIAVKGYGTATRPGTVDIYNNTMYDCSSYLNENASSTSSCGILILPNQLNVTTQLVNNIVYQPGYAGTSRQNVFLCGGDGIGTVAGSNNLWFSETSPRRVGPADKYGLSGDPMFLSTSDFHLQSGSPAIGAGIPYGGLTSDADGRTRPNPPSIGAYEQAGGQGAAHVLAPMKADPGIGQWLSRRVLVGVICLIAGGTAWGLRKAMQG